VEYFGRFSYAEPFLHLWDEADLVMVEPVLQGIPLLHIGVDGDWSSNEHSSRCSQAQGSDVCSSRCRWGHSSGGLSSRYM
ncbi:hypothetical protein LEMLEM_LOCUS1204, partial [Lemmus lemmus]